MSLQITAGGQSLKTDIVLKRTPVLIKRKFMEYFVPTVLTAMANSIAMLVDSTIVNITLGINAFSAVNLMSPIVQLYVALSILLGMSCATVIAKFKGEEGGAAEKSSAVFSMSVFALLGVSLLLIVLQLLFNESIVSLLTKDAALQKLLKAYYLPFILGTPITLLTTGCVYIIRTEGRPKFASAIIFVSNAVNLVFDLLLIALFKTGIAGAAAATVIGNFVGLLMILSHFRRRNSGLKLSFRSVLSEGGFAGNLKLLLEYGISGALGAALITIRVFFLNSLVQRWGGSQALAAMSIISLCQILDSAFVAGACQTMVTLSGMLFGERDIEGLRFSFLQAMKILLISTLSITLVMELAAGAIASAYGMTGGAALSMGSEAIRICALMFPTDALTFLGIYHCISIGQNKISTLASVMNGVGFILPLGLILPRLWGLKGVWLSLPLSQLLTLLLVCLEFLKLKGRGSAFNEALDDALFSFSLNSESWTAEKEKALNARLPGREEAINALSGCLRSLDEAPSEKNRPSKNTDVRICPEITVIKNSGALLQEKDFAAADFSKVLGFNRIVL